MTHTPLGAAQDGARIIIGFGNAKQAEEAWEHFNIAHGFKKEVHDGLLEALERSHGWNLKVLAGIKSGKIPDQTMLYTDGTDQTLSDALDEVTENNAAAIKAARP